MKLLIFVTFFPFSIIGLTLIDDEIKQPTLIAIETQLQKNNTSLNDFKSMLYPKDFVLSFFGNRLVYEERQYEPIAQEFFFNDLYSSLTGKFSIHQHI